MQQSLIIAFLLVALLATSAQAAPQAITVYVHADQPVANMPVTASNNGEAINTATDANGIAHLAIGAGEWSIETCGQSVPIEMLDEDGGTGGLLVIGCYRALLPMAVK